MSGQSDKKFRFNEICSLLLSLGFQERKKGSHHIFCRMDVQEIINIQPKNGDAKPYQVKQIRNLILKYKLGDFYE